MKGKEIMEFLKTQVIVEEPVDKGMDNLMLLAKYKEKTRRAYARQNG